MKKVITLSILLISLFAFSLIIFAQTEDTITITTYYPSPYESYNYLDVEEKLGIGTKNPQAAIHIFNEENAADDKKEIIVDTINDTGVPKVSLRKARGTLSSPTAVTTGNWLGNYAFLGYDGASYALAARIVAAAAQDWSPTSRGSKLLFETTDLNGTTTNPRMIINADGMVGIGTIAPKVALDVNGAIRMGRIDLYSNLPAPSADLQGALLFVQDKDKPYVCDGTNWNPIDMSPTNLGPCPAGSGVTPYQSCSGIAIGGIDMSSLAGYGFAAAWGSCTFYCGAMTGATCVLMTAPFTCTCYSGSVAGGIQGFITPPISVNCTN